MGKDLHLHGESIRRAMNGDRGIGPESALRLARVNGEDHLAALEDAGHRDLANLLRDIYEQPSRRRLTKRQAQFLDYLANMRRADQQALFTLAQSLAEKSGERDDS